MARRLSTPQENWNNDDIQFPRLLAEIMATVDFTTRQWDALCSSMDLDRPDILELFDRAQAKWDRIKEQT